MQPCIKAHTLTFSTVGFGLLIPGFLLELHVSTVHDRSHDLVNPLLLLPTEPQHVERFLCEVIIIFNCLSYMFVSCLFCFELLLLLKL